MKEEDILKSLVARPQPKISAETSVNEKGVGDGLTA